MPPAKSPLAVLLGIALLAFAPSASAAEVVPPGNSAAAQYTEAFPTSGGERETDGRKPSKAVPAEVLGAGNARRLEEKGEDGRAVAELAAETAPAPASTGSPATESEQAEPSGDADRSGSDQADSGGSGGTGGGSGPGASSGGERSGSVEKPDGSSGLSEVLGQMTGSSSGGELGLWLPLIALGAVLGSLLYLWRQRHRVA